MRHFVGGLALGAALSGCVTQHPVVSAPVPWAERLPQLQRAIAWQLDGRAAVALGAQGWQASLTWRESAAGAEVHLSGPLGVGAVVLRQTVAGISLNDAPPSDNVQLQLQERLGFDLPIDELKYWLLGVPDPAAAFEMTRNAEDRALTMTQSGWGLSFDGYKPVGADVLPTRLVMTREDVRVRIVVDHWQDPR